ncbi:hypothetical protein EDC04DRAFT_2576705 [Pisolithus marmoratus]|nr:hypothetical protein EDC04DRAFT_2576705 [Pisolithus marmoratus]
MSNSSKGDSSQTANGQKCVCPSVLELGPRKRLTTQGPLVHCGCHFGQAVHAFCNVLMLLTNGIILLSEGGSDTLESLTVDKRKEFMAFQELLRVVPGLELQLVASSEEEVIEIGELIQKGINGAHADDTKGMKGTIIDWITLKGQSLSPHIPCNMKSGRGFNHECTGALLCPAGLDWTNIQTRTKLMNGEIQVPGNQWLVFFYADYTYDLEDPWNGLLCSGLLVSAYKHIFTSPSSVDQEPKATHSGNVCIHGMHCVTKVSIVYVAMQTCFSLTSAQVFSHTDLITDSEQFYSSIMELLDNSNKSNEVDQLITWWNRQIFPLYTASEQLPSKNSALARICQKRVEYKELHDADNDL